PIGAVYASTMLRAIQTARPYADLAGHRVVTDEGVVEFDRDAGSYTPMEELKRDNYEAWKRFVARGRRRDGVAEFQATVVQALERIVARHPGQRVAVFCHGGGINGWTAHVLE